MGGRGKTVERAVESDMQRQKRKGLNVLNLRTANVFLAVLVGLTLILSLLLYSGMVSTRRDLDELRSTHAVPPAMVADLAQHYQRMRTLEVVLIVMSACMALGLFVIYRYLVRVSRTLRQVQTIDRDILNSIARGIVTIDLQRRITSCNRAMEQILGVRAVDFFGRPLEVLFPPGDPLYEMLQTSVQQEAGTRELDLEHPGGSGRKIPLRATTFSLRNEVGERVGAILLLKDMTELRKMEERVQRASRLAALGQLTQKLVHEIRNPLSAMDINLQLLQERCDDLRGEDAETDRYISIINAEVRRLNEVLRNVRLFAHPAPPDLEDLDLHQVIRQVISVLRGEAEQRKVEIIDHLQAQDSLVRADEDQLQQVFINLFKNSIEAMGEGGKVEVISRNTGKGKTVTVEIVDTGPGIHMANIRRIFDPYYTTKKKGTGLGLSIVYNIIDQHGGSIDVGSWLGEGTLFSITLPLAGTVEQNHGNQQTENPHC